MLPLNMGLTLPQGNALRMEFEMGLFTGDISGVRRHWIGLIISTSPPCRLVHLLPFACFLPLPSGNPGSGELWFCGKRKKHLEFCFIFWNGPGYNAGGRLEMLLYIYSV